jgi:hypothetical protein
MLYIQAIQNKLKLRLFEINPYTFIHLSINKVIHIL